MKAVILAGGQGTRLSEETQLRPKPMVEIGGRPILWHIMKMYYAANIREFIICLGYKGYMIKEYFNNYFLHMSDVTFDMSSGSTKIHRSKSEDWKITLVDTGELDMTGSRIRQVLPYVEDDDAFCLTYGDGVADIDINALIEFHNTHDQLATMTAVRPPGRFGALKLEGSGGAGARIVDFVEKPAGDGGWINGGFFVLSPKVADYIPAGDDTVWEQEPLRDLAKNDQLMAFYHEGFWQPMDTARDRNSLKKLWASGNPPWRTW